MNPDRLLERFLSYVAVDTTAVEDSGCYPSSAGQWELGRILTDSLQQLDLIDVQQDEHGLVWATLRSNVDFDVPVIALNAHLDTSPESAGDNIRPQIVRNYSGGDLLLPGDTSRVIRVKDNPELNALHGQTLITTDGTTLLGADDKAGIAVIMECVTYLVEHPEIPHGPIRILFTCDEEIGKGVAHVDLEKLNAAVAYTLDGQGANEIDIETFSADLATITFRGINIHPSIAKDRMVNAIRAAGQFVDELPRNTLAPETTDGKLGFMHPYVVEGGVAEVTLKVLLRDFETTGLEEQAGRLHHLARQVEASFAGTSVDVVVKKQYRNMREGLECEPRAVAYAQQAHERLDRTCRLTSVRGGTDGSQLTELGLPTPNLSTGEHNPHSPLEWCCLEEMVQAAELLVELVQVWATER